MKAMWRNEVVTVVSAKNGKVQIARKCGLRWVKPEELTICAERGADYDRMIAGLKGK
mgnify:CR=1 FL=1